MAFTHTRCFALVFWISAQEGLPSVVMCRIPALSDLQHARAQARLLGGRNGGLLAALAREAGAAARLSALSARDRPAAANLSDEIAALEGPPVAVMAALRELGQVLRSSLGRTHLMRNVAMGLRPAVVLNLHGRLHDIWQSAGLREADGCCNLGLNSKGRLV